MKILPWLALLFLFVGGAGKAEAAPCSAGSLSDYSLLASCSLGGLDVSGFTIGSFSGASAQLDPSAIQVLPSATGFALASASPVAADAGELFGLRFLFHLSGNGLSGGSIALGDDPAATGTGSITDLFGIADSFDNVIASAAAFAVEGLSDPVAIFTSAPSSFFDVFVEIGIDGGPAGTASMGPTLATLNFNAVSAVPEPDTLSLLSLSLLLLPGLVRAARRRG